MSLRDKIEHAIQNQPCMVKDLKAKFGGDRAADRKVMEALDELVHDAVVCQKSGVFFTARSGRAEKALPCKVVKLGKNFAFVMLEDESGDIFIPGRFTRGAMPGDMVLVMSGDSNRKVQTMLGVLRIEMGNRLGLRDPKVFAPLWIVDFPLLEWSEEDGRFYAMHHPFTAPKPEHMNLFYSDKKEDLERVCANAYDFVLNGTELGGGSIRIHDAEVQKRMFEVLGIGPEEAEYKFGFIIHAFQYGAPPHGGLAFGFDRVCTLFAGKESIRDFIAFPKNNQGRDVMIDAPSKIDQTQLDELSLDLRPQQEK